MEYRLGFAVNGVFLPETRVLCGEDNNKIINTTIMDIETLAVNDLVEVACVSDTNGNIEIHQIQFNIERMRNSSL